jgi:hypothetical protein
MAEAHVALRGTLGCMSATTKPSLVLARVDREMPTPRASGTHAAFRDAAAALIEELTPRRGVQLADALIEQAAAARDEFDAWPATQPDVAQRSSAIQRLIELREQVSAYLHGR